MSAAPDPLLLVSGFGPFEAFELNPSGELARALAAEPPPGLRVRARVLPVSFERAPRVWDELLAELAVGERPALCLGLGVARKAGFRLERFGGPALKLVDRPDVDGRTAHAFSREGPALASSLDLVRLRSALVRRGVQDARVSRTAGGYVCERIYHHLLVRAGELGAPGLFVHVPPVRFAPFERQLQVLRWVLEELALGADSAGHR
jgi:pyroglutamyl-peptidase